MEPHPAYVTAERFFKSDTQRKTNWQMPTKSCRKLIDIILKPPGIIKIVYHSAYSNNNRFPVNRPLTAPPVPTFDIIGQVSIVYLELK